MSITDIIRHKYMIWGSSLGALVVAWNLYSLYDVRTELSDKVLEDSMAACEQASDPDACRDRVEDFHDGCYRWSLTRHDEYPEIDQDKYAECLKHPPGKIRHSSD